MAFPKVGLRKIKRKKGFVYQIDYNLNGKRFREVVGTNKSFAEIRQTDIQNKINFGAIGIDYKKEKISLTKLFNEYLTLKQNLDEKSKNRYDNYYKEFNIFLERYFQHAQKDITQIRTNYVKESIDKFTTLGTSAGRIWQPKTANGYKIFLATLFKYAIKNKYIVENPVSDIPDLKVVKKVIVEYFSEDEVTKIFKEIPPHWENYFLFILNTGLRKGEINNLTWNKVFDKKRKIAITSSEDWDPKHNSGRIVPLNDIAMKIIKEQNGKNNKFVFTNEAGINVTEKQSYDRIKKVLKNLKINGDVHKFRHTFASNFMMQGAGSIYDLSKILGHKDIETTMIYAHLADEHLLKTLQKLKIKK